MRVADRFKLLFCVLALMALLAVATTVQARADTQPSPTPLDGQSLTDDQLAIVNLTADQLTPTMRDCLKKHLVGECLQQQASQYEKTHQSLDHLQGKSVDAGTTSAWKNFLASSIVQGGPTWVRHGMAFMYSINVDGKRMDMDEIANDPNRVATDRKLGSNAVWVRHEFEIVPQFGYGFNDKTAPETFEDQSSYYGAVISANAIMWMVKRHPMDQHYNQDFWGEMRGDWHILSRQWIPAYFKVFGGGYNGTHFLPGESLAFERYGTISIGIGPGINLIGSPVNIQNWISTDLYAGAGLTLSLARGHYRTTMEVQEDGLLHLTLEKINQDSEKLGAELGGGFGLPFGIVSFSEILFKLETGVIHTRDTILDMTFDPKYPEAMKALDHAYFGFFGEAQALAAQADHRYHGITSLARTTLVETTHEHAFEIFPLNKKADESEIKITTTPDGSPSSVQNTTVDEVDKERSTLMSDNRLLITVDTDDNNPDPDSNRSFSLKWRFTTDNAKTREVRELLDAASLFAPESQTSAISRWQDIVRGHVERKEKCGKLQAYFYLSFDPKVFADLLTEADPDVYSRWESAWAKLIGLPAHLAEKWASLSIREQEDAVRDIPGAGNHLKQFRNIANGLKAAVSKRTPLRQVHALMKKLKKANADLYPLLALAEQVDREHLLVFERVTLGKEMDASTIEFNDIGSSYIFPVKTLY